MKTFKNIWVFLLIASAAQAQIFSTPSEKVVFSVFVDPGASVKEQGLDIGVEFGYEGVIYAKLQFENFEALQGGYTSFGAGIGGNFQQGNLKEYAGVRLVPKVWRNGSSNPIFGFEGGIDYWIDPALALGVRSTLDWREDMNLLENDTAIWRASGYIKITFNLFPL